MALSLTLSSMTVALAAADGDEDLIEALAIQIGADMPEGTKAGLIGLLNAFSGLAADIVQIDGAAS